MNVAAGRFIDARDLKDRNPVCVIGSEVKRAAFLAEDPIGKLIKIGDQDFRIIGVTQERSARPGAPSSPCGT